MKFDGVKLPAEYTDLLLLLSKIPAIYQNMSLKIRTYTGKDLLLTNNHKGELFTFCDGSPLKILGSKLSIKEKNIEDDRIWDACVTCEFSKHRFSKEQYLNSLERICEKFGYTLINIEENKLYFEIMDRVIFMGYSIESSQALCYDFDIDYEEICAIAIRRKQSTYQVLEQQLTVSDMNKMYMNRSESTTEKNIKLADEENSTINKQKDDINRGNDSNTLKGVNIFNDNKNSKSR